MKDFLACKVYLYDFHKSSIRLYTNPIEPDVLIGSTLALSALVLILSFSYLLQWRHL